MNELNPQNAFGELLLDLIEAQYGEENIDAGIEAIMETTGLGEEEVIAFIEGTAIVEDESLLSSIIDAFPDADDADLEVIVNVATAVDEADRNALIAEIEADQEGMDDDMGMEEDPSMEMSPEEAEYAYHASQTANFNASRISALENHIADFQEVSYFSNSLREIDEFANRYVDAELLPPSYKTMLIGNFTDDSSRLANFAEAASRNGVDLATMEFATRYALSLMTDASDFVDFKDYSVTDEDIAIANFSANLSSVAEEDFKAIFGNI